MAEKKIKVLIADDSHVSQRLLKGIIDADNRFEVVAIAENGKQAIEYINRYNPDVVSMDFQMPVMDGVEATRKIMQECPVPIVIVSSFYQTSEVEMAIKLLEAGAVAILTRPHGPGHSQFNQNAKHYINTLKSMSEVKVVRRRNVTGQKPVIVKNTPVTNDSFIPNVSDYKILAIGASAGGPEGIRTILANLPSNFPLPVLIVQHIDSHFSEGFCAWLNTTSAIPVHIAGNNDQALPGHAYIPPGDHHLSLKSKGILQVSKEPMNLIHRPSVDHFFKSVAMVYGKDAIAVLLSGMGKDGAQELKHLYDLGAFTLAQDEQSCLVFGMPGEAVKLGAARRILNPENIIKEINKLFSI